MDVNNNPSGSDLRERGKGRMDEFCDKFIFNSFHNALIDGRITSSSLRANNERQIRSIMGTCIDMDTGRQDIGFYSSLFTRLLLGDQRLIHPFTPEVWFEKKDYRDHKKEYRNSHVAIFTIAPLAKNYNINEFEYPGIDSRRIHGQGAIGIRSIQDGNRVTVDSHGVADVFVHILKNELKKSGVVSTKEIANYHGPLRNFKSIFNKANAHRERLAHRRGRELNDEEYNKDLLSEFVRVFMRKNHPLHENNSATVRHITFLHDLRTLFHEDEPNLLHKYAELIGNEESPDILSDALSYEHKRLYDWWISCPLREKFSKAMTIILKTVYKEYEPVTNTISDVTTMNRTNVSFNYWTEVTYDTRGYVLDTVLDKYIGAIAGVTSSAKHSKELIIDMLNSEIKKDPYISDILTNIEHSVDMARQATLRITEVTINEDNFLEIVTPPVEIKDTKSLMAEGKGSGLKSDGVWDTPTWKDEYLTVVATTAMVTVLSNRFMKYVLNRGLKKMASDTTDIDKIEFLSKEQEYFREILIAGGISTGYCNTGLNMILRANWDRGEYHGTKLTDYNSPAILLSKDSYEKAIYELTKISMQPNRPNNNRASYGELMEVMSHYPKEMVVGSNGVGDEKISAADSARTIENILLSKDTNRADFVRSVITNRYNDEYALRSTPGKKANYRESHDGKYYPFETSTINSAAITSQLKRHDGSHKKIKHHRSRFSGGEIELVKENHDNLLNMTSDLETIINTSLEMGAGDRHEMYDMIKQAAFGAGDADRARYSISSAIESLTTPKTRIYLDNLKLRLLNDIGEIE